MVRETAHDVFADAPTARQLADLGWHGFFTPEEMGGSGWHPMEACVVAEEAGAAYSPSSWAESALAASALSTLSQASHQVDSVLSGAATASFCTGRMSFADASIQLASGDFPFSAGLPAEILVVADQDGIVGAVIDGVDGVSTIDQVGALDTTRSMHCLRLTDAAAVPIEASQVARLTATAQMLICADSVGALRAAIGIVTNHLVERQAFGSSLASFQVIQHRLVDLTILHLSAQALVYRAAQALEDDDGGAMVDAAHLYLSGRAVPALEDCIQLAGGMGFTWEFGIHHALRRALTNGIMVRTARQSGVRLAAARGWAS